MHPGGGSGPGLCPVPQAPRPGAILAQPHLHHPSPQFRQPPPGPTWSCLPPTPPSNAGHSQKSTAQDADTLLEALGAPGDRLGSSPLHHCHQVSGKKQLWGAGSGSKVSVAGAVKSSTVLAGCEFPLQSIPSPSTASRCPRASIPCTPEYVEQGATVAVPVVLQVKGWHGLNMHVPQGARAGEQPPPGTAPALC